MSKTSARAASSPANTSRRLRRLFLAVVRLQRVGRRPISTPSCGFGEAVFIVEQNCPYPDSDGRDPNAWHLLGWGGALERASTRGLRAHLRAGSALR